MRSAAGSSGASARGLARRHRGRARPRRAGGRPELPRPDPSDRRRGHRRGGMMTTTDPRERFARTSVDVVDADPTAALVYAEISGQYLGDARRRHPDRVINVGIREQLLVSTGAGLALSGMTPIVHTFGSFLTERPFEQIKLDFVHRGVGGVLVDSGGSFDIAAGGRPHQSPGDVALLATLPGVAIHV